MKSKTLVCIFIFLILLWLLPLWAFEFLPFVDLPQHLAIAQIVHNYNNPQVFSYSKFFQLKFFPKAYILHELFLHLLSFVMPVEIAGKIFISLIVILLPISIYLYIKALGGNPWYSLLSFFFIYNYNLMWGFIAYCLGISVFFFMLYLLLQPKRWEKEGLRADLGLCLLLVLGVFLHAYIYLLLLLSFLVITLINKLKVEEITQKLMVILPSLIFFFLWAYPWIEKKRTAFKDVSRFLPSLSSIPERLQKLPGYLFCWRPLDKTLFWFILAVFFSLFILGIIRTIKDRKLSLDRKEQATYLLILVVLVLYLCLPLHLHEMSFMGPRLASFIPLLLIGPLSKVKLSRVTPFVVLSLIILAVLWSSLMSGFYTFNFLARPVGALLEKTEKNKRLVELYTYPQENPFYFHSFLHFGCYYQIRKGGLCGFIFPQKDSWHIVETKEGVDLPYVNVFKSWESMFPKGWENFDYFLVCGQPTAEQEQWLKDPAKLRLIGEEGIWRLYEKP